MTAMKPNASPDLPRDLRAGVTLQRAGRLDDAARQYRTVLRYAPEQPDALNLLGVIAHEQGRLNHAKQLLARAIRAKPRFPEALANLARAQRVAGDSEGALENARQAVTLNPRLPEAQIQLGCALLDAEDYAGAAAACRAAIALVPDSLDAHVNLGAALIKLKDWEAAAKTYQIAHSLKPDRAETLTDFAFALQEMNLLEPALRCHERAAALAPDDPRVHAAQALTLKRAQNAEGAAAACRRTLALAPDRADIWMLLGSSLAALGRFTEAVAAYNHALAIDPELAEARRGLVVTGQLAANETDMARLRAIANDPHQPSPGRISAGFALGGLFDKAGEYDQAFTYFTLANCLARKELESSHRAFDRNAFRRQIDALIAGWTPEAFATLAGCGEASELPIFIVGMPRSGTTLTEQIAASHHAVFGAGELRDIGMLSVALAGRIEDFNPLGWDRGKLRRVAADHLAHLRQMAGDASRVTDKMPDNLFWLGTIAVLFPNARVVLCRRDLRDACLSCYFQNFSAGLSWAQGLDDLAFRAREVERLIAHWRTVLPIRMLELYYENVIADLEGQSRRLIDFLGLEWDPTCLNFHETERQVLTASLWQVRQPLYASSVGRWRLYRNHLDPLIEGLGNLVPREIDETGVGLESLPGTHDDLGSGSVGNLYTGMDQCGPLRGQGFES